MIITVLNLVMHYFIEDIRSLENSCIFTIDLFPDSDNLRPLKIAIAAYPGYSIVDV